MRHTDAPLFSGESGVFRTRPHWIVCAKPLLIALVLIAVAGFGGEFVSNRQPNLFDRMYLLSESRMLALTLLFLAAVFVVLFFTSSDCVLTNQRLIITIGLFSHRCTNLFLNQVESVSVEQSFVGLVLNYGTVIVHGAGGTTERHNRIAKACEFQQKIQEQIKAG